MRLTRSLTSAIFASVFASSLACAVSAQDTTKPAPPKVNPATAQKSKDVAATAGLEFAVFHTNKGDIVVELNHEKAPVSVDNFTQYIKSGFFDGTVFHRVVPGFVIQGGGFTPDGNQKKTQSPIANEWQNGLKNKRGTLSMARTNDPNSASSQFFVSLKDNDMLDQPISGGAGYAVFGKVIAGMDVVDTIATSKRTVKFGMKDWPTEDTTVSTCEMLTKEKAEELVKKANAAAASSAKEPVEKPTAPVAPAAPAAPAAPKGG